MILLARPYTHVYPSTQYDFVKSRTVLFCFVMAWCCRKLIIRVGGCDRHNYYQKYIEVRSSKQKGTTDMMGGVPVALHCTSTCRKLLILFYAML